MGTKIGAGGVTLQTYASDPGTATAGQMYFNSTDNIVRAYSGTKWETLSNVILDGSSSYLAGLSAKQIKADTGATTDGLYWIDIPGVGATQVYCDMNTYGGGWMLAMRIDSTLGTGTVRHYFDPTWWNGTSYSAAPSTARTNGEIKTAVYTDFPHEECMLEYGYGSSYWANRAYARYTEPTSGSAQKNNTLQAKMNSNTHNNGDTMSDYRWVKQESNNNTFFPNSYLHINYSSSGVNTQNDFFRFWFNDVPDTETDGTACNQIGGFGMSGDFGSYDSSSFRSAYSASIGYSSGNASATISPPYGSDPNTCQWNDTRAMAGTSGLNFNGSTNVRIGSDYYNNGVAIIWVR